LCVTSLLPHATREAYTYSAETGIHKYLNEFEYIYVAAVEKKTLDGANAFTF